MYADEEKYFERDISPLLGVNTAAAPGTLAPGQWRVMWNGYQAKLGSNAKRPGSVPVTSTPLSATIERLMVYRSGASEKLLATSGTSIYKYASGALTALTGALNSADVWDVDFTDENLNSRKLIVDGGSLKEYNDATETVSAVVPATDDPSPAPRNVLADINALGIKYLFVYYGQVFVSDGKDRWWYSNPYSYKYFPEVQLERWVRQNDYMMGPGIAFDNTVLLPMRRGWGIMTGKDFDDIVGNQFLNTINGVIASRSVQRITYPNGVQSIVYLSDDGVYEIYDTGFEGTGSRRYSTRSLMTDKVDFEAIGLTDAEKSAAVGYFDAKMNLYLLKVNKGSERLVWALDVRNMEWYPWSNIKANDFERIDDTLYYAGETKLLHKFDASLGSDWDDSAKTTGTPVDWDCVTDVIAFGDISYLDYLRVWARQFPTKSTMDVSIRTLTSTVDMSEALQNQIMIWGTGEYGIAQWYNVDFTDLVGRPWKGIFKKRSPFFQLRFRNNKDELIEMYKYAIEGRVVD